MTPVQQKSAELIRLIEEYDYYTLLLNDVLGMMSMSVENLTLGVYQDTLLITFWNKFWFALPDDRYIRRPPFNELCEICEMMFDGDEDMS